MHIPEWEVEELLKCNPALLGFPSQDLKLVESQKYLAKSGRYIDLLFKNRDNYLIVEIKSPTVKDKSIVVDQLLEYKKYFAEETGIPEEKISCILISPNGFTNELIEFCEKTGVIAKTIDQGRIVNAIRKLNEQKQSLDSYCIVDKSSIPSKTDITESKRKNLAELLSDISRKAPIEAHEVNTESQGELSTDRDKWFWLFYSVMDRRANAATFVRAKEALERERLFAPYKIVELVEKEGESLALRKIARILKKANFPLLTDHSKGELAFPKSIADAARFMSKYNYDFGHLYEDYAKQYIDLHEARNALWKTLQDQIYGVGPRIASQIIRGLVLKGSWDFPLDDNRFLEECRFNVWIAGQTRLGLVDTESDYYEQLGDFADKYLSGNRGVIAHALWFIRKRYCGRPPKCNECDLARHCKRAFSFSSQSYVHS
jgi:hypothetical protein